MTTKYELDFQVVRECLETTYDYVTFIKSEKNDTVMHFTVYHAMFPLVVSVKNDWIEVSDNSLAFETMEKTGYVTMSDFMFSKNALKKIQTEKVENKMEKSNNSTFSRKCLLIQKKVVTLQRVFHGIRFKVK